LNWNKAGKSSSSKFQSQDIQLLNTA